MTVYQLAGQLSLDARRLLCSLEIDDWVFSSGASRKTAAELFKHGLVRYRTELGWKDTYSLTWSGVVLRRALKDVDDLGATGRKRLLEHIEGAKFFSARLYEDGMVNCSDARLTPRGYAARAVLEAIK